MRHCRMARHYAFGERLGQCFDRVALRQVTERWRQTHRTGAGEPNGMAPRTLLFGNGLAAFAWRALTYTVSAVRAWATMSAMQTESVGTSRIWKACGFTPLRSDLPT